MSGAPLSDEVFRGGAVTTLGSLTDKEKVGPATILALIRASPSHPAKRPFQSALFRLTAATAQSRPLASSPLAVHDAPSICRWCH